MNNIVICNTNDFNKIKKSSFNGDDINLRFEYGSTTYILDKSLDK